MEKFREFRNRFCCLGINDAIGPLLASLIVICFSWRDSIEKFISRAKSPKAISSGELPSYRKSSFSVSFLRKLLHKTNDIIKRSNFSEDSEFPIISSLSIVAFSTKTCKISPNFYLLESHRVQSECARFVRENHVDFAQLVAETVVLDDGPFD